MLALSQLLLLIDKDIENNFNRYNIMRKRYTNVDYDERGVFGHFKEVNTCDLP